MGVSKELPVTGYIKMVDVWMIFTISYPFLQISLHSMMEVSYLIYVWGARSTLLKASYLNVVKIFTCSQQRTDNLLVRVFQSLMIQNSLES